MKPLYIYYVRHGRTQFNVAGMVQGWNDSPLAPEGIFQARCTGNGLKGVVFDKAYSGPAGRQKSTGRLVLDESGNKEIEITVSDDFREMGYGDLQGGTVAFMMQEASRVLNVEVISYHNKQNLVTPYDISDAIAKSGHQAEPLEESSARLFAGIERVVKENPEGGNVLVATSACAVDITCRTVFPEILHYRLPENCSVTLIKYEDGKYSLESYSDISYRLAGEKVLQD